MLLSKRQNIQSNVNTKVDVVINVEPKVINKINIFDAIKNSDFDKIKAYINAGGDINVKNILNETPMIVAIKEGWDASKLKQFLAMSDEINLSLPNNNGNPIEMAVKLKDPMVLEIFAEYNGGIKFGKDIILDKFNNIPIYSDTKFVLAKNLDYSGLKNYDYGQNFINCPEGNMLFQIQHMNDKEFQEVFNQYKEFEVGSAGRELGFFLTCVRYGYDSKEVSQLIKSGFYTDFSGYLLSMGKGKINYFDSANAFEDEKFKFYLDHVKDLDAFISDFIKLHNEKNFKAGFELIDYLYDLREQKLGAPVPEDESGTIYVNDVLDSNINTINFDNNLIQVEVNICSNNQCVLVKVDVAQLPVLQHMEGITLA